MLFSSCVEKINLVAERGTHTMADDLRKRRCVLLERTQCKDIQTRWTRGNGSVPVQLFLICNHLYVVYKCTRVYNLWVDYKIITQAVAKSIL